MTPAKATEIIRLLEDNGIEVWLDGGWGVDALLGEQTRPHKDLDIIVGNTHLAKLRHLFSKEGFKLLREDSPSNFVMTDFSGHEVDVHVITIDQDGNGLHKMANGETWVFPSEGLKTWGRIADVAVRCLSAEVQVQCHAAGYELTEKDFHDMELLRETIRSDTAAETSPQLARQLSTYAYVDMSNSLYDLNCDW